MITRDIVALEKLGVFNCRLMIVCGDSDYVKDKMVELGFKRESFEKIHFGFKTPETEDYNAYCCAVGHTVLIQMSREIEKKKIVDILSHEVHHAVKIIGNLIDTKQCDETEEVFAYTTGWLCQFVYDQIIDYIE